MGGPVIPRKLRAGDQVRIVAPAMSRAMVMEHDHSAIAAQRYAELGLRLTFGEHVDERDRFDSSPVTHRVEDLHAAFADPDVAMIHTVIGGFSSNELLDSLNFELIAANPKILCGYSDITALQNAILTRANLVTYSGPHWSTFGMRDHLDQTYAWFRACLFDEAPIEVRPSPWFTDDLWFLDQDNRQPAPADGWWALQPGTTTGRVVGGNLCTLNLLQGTTYFPSLDGALLVIEDDLESNAVTFARDLTSLLAQPGADRVTGLVIGRFQTASKITRADLEQIVATRPGLAGLPVLANVDVGHTNPILTLPIGGLAEVHVGETGDDCRFVITKH